MDADQSTGLALGPDLPSSVISGNQSFLDAGSILLPDGTVMVAPVGYSTNASLLIFNPASNSWSAGPPAYSPNQDEASWVRLRDGSILTVDPSGVTSERYIPALTNWVQDAGVPVALYSAIGNEIGPALMLPNGNAFFLGGSGHTAIYIPAGGTNQGQWVAGPDIPNGLTAADAPAAMMPNGKILCAVAGAPNTNSQGGKTQFPTPTSFFEYDYSVGSVGAFTQVNGPTGQTDNVSSFETAMLVLPDGSVLYANSQEQNSPATGAKLYVYVPIGDSVLAGKPYVFNITPNQDGSFHLDGYNLNGISAGAAYGDDGQMSTDYPLVQFMDTNNAHIDYARTFEWTTIGVGSGSGSVDFSLPPGLIPQTYLVSVIANGIHSDPVVFSFVNPSSLALCPGDTGSLSVITAPQPATYQWFLNGNPVPNQTNAQLTIVNATTNDAGFYTLTVKSGTGSTTSLAVPVSVGVLELSQPPATDTAALCQPKSMSILARGKGPLTAQWFQNGKLIVPDARVTLTNFVNNGVTQFTLSIADAHFEDDATYHAVITDGCGPVSTSPWALRVVPNPPWIRIATDGPSPRYNASMAYDSDRHVAVLFGGAVPNVIGPYPTGGTWEFDGTNWNQRFPATSPDARHSATMTYDSKRHRTVMFGGIVYNGIIDGLTNSLETWEWDGNTWTKIPTTAAPPTSTYTESAAVAACYDSWRGETLVFGGMNSTGTVSQLWGYDGSDWHLRWETTNGPAWTPICTTMAFDSNRGVAVLVGAKASSPTSGNAWGESVWEWDGTVWHEPFQLGQEPALVFGGNGFAYDAFRHECVLYGLELGEIDGKDPTQQYPDNYRWIWRWNGADWQADPPTPTPGVAFHFNHSMCFDTFRNAMIVFGSEQNVGNPMTNFTYELVYQAEPAVLRAPTVEAASIGQPAQLNVVAAGAPPIGYQWLKDGVALTDDAHFTGSSTDTLNINAVTSGDAGHYQVALSNLCGVASSGLIQFKVVAGQLTFSSAGGQGTISWTNPAAALQTSPNVYGPWMDVSGAISPYSITTSAAQAYFRLIQ